jgi:hypothetical protein
MTPSPAKPAPTDSKSTGSITRSRPGQAGPGQPGLHGTGLIQPDDRGAGRGDESGKPASDDAIQSPARQGRHGI